MGGDRRPPPTHHPQRRPIGRRGPGIRVLWELYSRVARLYQLAAREASFAARSRRLCSNRARRKSLGAVDTDPGTVLSIVRLVGTNGTVHDTLDDLKEACRRHGVPLTVQRAVIFEALVGREDHPTADQLLEAVRAKLPGLSRMTVYRVLDTLTRIGLAVKTCSPGTAVRFDPRTERHHHLVCLSCDAVLDLHDPALDRLRLASARRAGFEVTDYSVHFRGLCARCRDGSGKGKGRASSGGGAEASSGRAAKGTAPEPSGTGRKRRRSHVAR